MEDSERAGKDIQIDETFEVIVNDSKVSKLRLRCPGETGFEIRGGGGGE